MNKELRTKIVFASLLAGFSTMAGANMVQIQPMHTDSPAVSPVSQDLVVSQAARDQIDAKLQRAAFSPETLEDKFYQIKRPKSTFSETGPDDVETPVHVSMKL